MERSGLSHQGVLRNLNVTESGKLLFLPAPLARYDGKRERETNNDTTSRLIKSIFLSIPHPSQKAF
jgi:hypothetical protein